MPIAATILPAARRPPGAGQRVRVRNPKARPCSSNMPTTIHELTLNPTQTKRTMIMKSARNLASLLVAACFVCALPHSALAQDKATPQELVLKVREAAGSLSKSGEPGLADFDKKPGPWVWKDTYIFVLDCTKGVMAAHPMKAELIGKPVTALKDIKGNPAFELLCAATQSPNGTWAEYWIP